MLDAIAELSGEENQKVDLIATFLGAHAVPKEYAGRTGEYVDLIINEMLPKVKGKSKCCDVFCEKNVFEVED